MFKWITKPYIMWTVIDDIACTVSILLIPLLIGIVTTVIDNIRNKGD